MNGMKRLSQVFACTLAIGVAVGDPSLAQAWNPIDGAKKVAKGVGKGGKWIGKKVVRGAKKGGQWVAKRAVNVIDPMPSLHRSLPRPTPLGSIRLGWIGVVDNGEGQGRPHGPLGNLHLQVFDERGREVLHIILRGPSRSEFNDGDEMRYRRPELLYNWQHPGERIGVRVWESDPGGPLLGRAHDVLFDCWISRHQTLQTITMWDPSRPAARDALSAVRARNPRWFSRYSHMSGVPSIFLEMKTWLPNPPQRARAFRRPAGRPVRAPQPWRPSPRRYHRR